jgi:hypothetical protein
MIDAQGQIDHLHGFGNDFGPAAKAREKMADVAVVLLDGERQVFAREELVFGDETVEPFPVVGEESLAREADFIEELLTGGVITATKHPGDGAASDRVIRAPNPELASLFLRKCQMYRAVDPSTEPPGGDGRLTRSNLVRRQPVRMLRERPAVTLP